MQKNICVLCSTAFSRSIQVLRSTGVSYMQMLSSVLFGPEWVLLGSTPRFYRGLCNLTFEVDPST